MLVSRSNRLQNPIRCGLKSRHRNTRAAQRVPGATHPALMTNANYKGFKWKYRANPWLCKSRFQSHRYVFGKQIFTDKSRLIFRLLGSCVSFTVTIVQCGIFCLTTLPGPFSSTPWRRKHPLKQTPRAARSIHASQ